MLWDVFMMLFMADYCWISSDGRDGVQIDAFVALVTRLCFQIRSSWRFMIIDSVHLSFGCRVLADVEHFHTSRCRWNFMIHSTVRLQVRTCEMADGSFWRSSNETSRILEEDSWKLTSVPETSIFLSDSTRVRRWILMNHLERLCWVFVYLFGHCLQRLDHHFISHCLSFSRFSWHWPRCVWVCECVCVCVCILL